MYGGIIHESASHVHHFPQGGRDRLHVIHGRGGQVPGFRGSELQNQTIVTCKAIE